MNLSHVLMRSRSRRTIVSSGSKNEMAWLCLFTPRLRRMFQTLDARPVVLTCIGHAELSEPSAMLNQFALVIRGLGPPAK